MTTASGIINFRKHTIHNWLSAWLSSDKMGAKAVWLKNLYKGEIIMKEIMGKITKRAAGLFIGGGLIVLIAGSILFFFCFPHLFGYLFKSKPDLFEASSQDYEEDAWFSCNNNILFDYYCSDNYGRYYITATNDGKYFGFYVRDKDVERRTALPNRPMQYMTEKQIASPMNSSPERDTSNPWMLPKRSILLIFLNTTETASTNMMLYITTTVLQASQMYSFPMMERKIPSMEFLGLSVLWPDSL